jgi:uncharacterized coiled-coil protein SlyX
MGKKAWVVAVLVSVLIVGFLGWRMLWRPNGESGRARLYQAQISGEKQKTIRTLEEQVTQLRKELEEGSKQIAKLQARLDEARMALQSAEQKLKSPGHTETRLAEARLSRRDKPTTEPRRQVQPDIYETIRTASVYKEPSVFSSKVATIPKGTRVRVVGSTGEWLEIRSTHGNPPGFIRREDTMFVRNGV